MAIFQRGLISALIKGYLINHLHFLNHTSYLLLYSRIPDRLHLRNKAILAVFSVLPLPDETRHEHISTTADPAACGIQDGISDIIQNYPADIGQTYLLAENIMPADGRYFPAKFGVDEIQGFFYVRHDS